MNIVKRVFPSQRDAGESKDDSLMANIENLSTEEIQQYIYDTVITAPGFDEISIHHDNQQKLQLIIERMYHLGFRLITPEEYKQKLLTARTTVTSQSPERVRIKPVFLWVEIDSREFAHNLLNMNESSNGSLNDNNFVAINQSHEARNLQNSNSDGMINNFMYYPETSSEINIVNNNDQNNYRGAQQNVNEESNLDSVSL